MTKKILQAVFLTVTIFTLAGCESRTGEIVETTNAASTRSSQSPSGAPTATPAFGKLNNPPQ